MPIVISSSKTNPSSTWTDQYFTNLETNGTLSTASRVELAEFSSRVGSRLPKIEVPLITGRISGGIVGSVQSGKTAAMIALAAHGLDMGNRIVIVLAGLKDDLRTQTSLRFTTDLLNRGDRIYDGGDSLRYTTPNGEGYHGPMGSACWSPHFADDINKDEGFLEAMIDALEEGKSVLVVTKKHASTLALLQDAVNWASRSSRAGHAPILVLDDECDEASVAANLEAPTPERIVEVWKDAPQHVTYIGITATPAANLLQNTDSPLFPGDFIEVSRVSSHRESSLEFREPSPDARYTGGYSFYHHLEDEDRDNFLVRGAMTQQEFEGVPGNILELEKSLIAYFVSGAIRLALQPECGFDPDSNPPTPHSMLAHTESLKDDHWQLCRQIMQILLQKGGSASDLAANIQRVPPVERIRSEDLEAWLNHEPERWSAFYTEFKDSRKILLELTPDRTRPTFPTWDQTRSLLPTVFKNTKLRVINSDESTVDKPLDFQSSFTSDGKQVAPRDVYSIIIGGNKLSRGLTIPGLCISYFTRSAKEITEDTTTQRGRWFGYRGSHLEFCRVFTYAPLALKLSRFQQHEEDLRRQIVSNIAEGRSPIDSTFRFLCIRNSKPTAKLGRGIAGTIDFSGSRPFIDRVQMGTSIEEKTTAEHNETLAANLSERINAEGQLIGPEAKRVACILRNVPGLDIAKLLEDFRYTFHNPVAITGAPFNLEDWYRKPISELPVTSTYFNPSQDPYLIAAYLKYWSHAYSDCQQPNQQRMYLAHDGSSRWSPKPVPTFNLALRYGTLKPQIGTSPFKHRLLNRLVLSDGVIGSRWGGHGYNSPGDEWIDGMIPPDGDPSRSRLAGAPGLALLHVIARSALGRSGGGTEYQRDRPTFGLVLPRGGPTLQYVVTK